MIKEVILLASVKVKKDAKKGGYKAVLIAELGCDEVQARKQKKKTVKENIYIAAGASGGITYLAGDIPKSQQQAGSGLYG